VRETIPNTRARAAMNEAIMVQGEVSGLENLPPGQRAAASERLLRETRGRSGVGSLADLVATVGVLHATVHLPGAVRLRRNRP